MGRWRVKGTVITLRGTAAHFVEEIEAAWERRGYSCPACRTMAGTTASRC